MTRYIGIGLEVYIKDPSGQLLVGEISETLQTMVCETKLEHQTW